MIIKRYIYNQNYFRLMERIYRCQTIVDRLVEGEIIDYSIPEFVKRSIFLKHLKLQWEQEIRQRNENRSNK